MHLVAASQFNIHLTLDGSLLESAGMTSERFDGEVKDKVSALERARQPHVKALLSTIRSGGVGLNLQEFNHPIFFDRDVKLITEPVTLPSFSHSSHHPTRTSLAPSASCSRTLLSHPTLAPYSRTLLSHPILAPYSRTILSHHTLSPYSPPVLGHLF